MAYSKPPITEAVIELRYKEPTEAAAIEKVAKLLSKEFPFDEPQQQLQIRVEPTGARVETSYLGKKLSSVDRTDIFVLGLQNFVCSRLAPYTGWDDFFDRAKNGWDIWRDHVGNLELSRIGVRYVNRIDIPIQKDEIIDLEKYLVLRPNTPDLGGAMSAFALQVNRPLGVDDCQLLLTSATVPSPLLGFASFLLDLDVSRESDLPRRPEDVTELLNRMRAHKNQVFESCVTDAARELFK
jgi:uncharacterized protein (TIGR04255 family)